MVFVNEKGKPEKEKEEIVSRVKSLCPIPLQYVSDDSIYEAYLDWLRFFKKKQPCDDSRPPQ